MELFVGRAAERHIRTCSSRSMSNRNAGSCSVAYGVSQRVIPVVDPRFFACCVFIPSRSRMLALKSLENNVCSTDSYGVRSKWCGKWNWGGFLLVKKDVSMVTCAHGSGNHCSWKQLVVVIVIIIVIIILEFILRFPTHVF
jgi:hypothetical protein